MKRAAKIAQGTNQGENTEGCLLLTGSGGKVSVHSGELSLQISGHLNSKRGDG